MTVLQNFNNYMIGLCGFQGSVYSEMTDLSGVASTDYNITHSGIIIFESSSPVDTPNPTLTTGQYRFKIAQSNTDIVDDETSVTHTITVENTGQTDLTFNRVGLILAESATSAIGACFLVLCDETEEVVVEPGMTVDFEYTIDLVNFLNLYDPQIYIDIETPPEPPTPEPVYDFSIFTKVGNPTIDDVTGIVSNITNTDYLTYTFENTITDITSLDIEVAFTIKSDAESFSNIQLFYTDGGQELNNGDIRIATSNSGLSLTCHRSSNRDCYAVETLEAGKTYRAKWVMDSSYNMTSYIWNGSSYTEVETVSFSSQKPALANTVYRLCYYNGSSSTVENVDFSVLKVTINGNTLLQLPLLNQS